MRQFDPRKIKALALDLDGTTLLPDTSLGERTAQCLKTLMSKGVDVIFCTGRAIEASEKYYSAIGAAGLMVFFNGAVLANVPECSTRDSSLLELDVVEFGIDIARSMDIHYQVYLPAGVEAGANSKWEALLIDKPRPEAEMYHRHTGITPLVKDLKTVIAAPGLPGCIKAMFITDPSLHDEIRQKMYARFGERIYVTRTSPTFLEVMKTGVSKGTGLAAVMQRRGLAPEAVIACGDEESDIPMFSVAGFAAAPSNAREKVREAADYVYGSSA
ncbi:MAG: HAD-IIB family hydrolase, partial [Treponema sp.]|nr:HAD-IIB family hydrolase [Treponema sp.]